jgi:hypothetical protein
MSAGDHRKGAEEKVELRGGALLALLLRLSREGDQVLREIKCAVAVGRGDPRSISSYQTHDGVPNTPSPRARNSLIIRRRGLTAFWGRWT